VICARNETAEHLSFYFANYSYENYDSRIVVIELNKVNTYNVSALPYAFSRRVYNKVKIVFIIKYLVHRSINIESGGNSQF